MELKAQLSEMCNNEIWWKKSVIDQAAISNYGTNFLFKDSYKDLGIMIDSGPKFLAHVDATFGTSVI